MLYAEDTCKRLVATGSHREEVYNREGQLNATFCEKEKQRPERAVIFEKNRSKLYIACSDMATLPTLDATLGVSTCFVIKKIYTYIWKNARFLC